MINQDDFHRACPDRYELLKDFARKHRENPTDAESYLWKYLKGKNLGVSFKRQVIILDYIADFYCPDQLVIIEVDGGYHFEGEQILLDEQRTKRLESAGYKVLRFTNKQVLSDINNVLDTIQNYLDNKHI